MPPVLSCPCPHPRGIPPGYPETADPWLSSPFPPAQAHSVGRRRGTRSEKSRWSPDVHDPLGNAPPRQCAAGRRYGRRPAATVPRQGRPLGTGPGPRRPARPARRCSPCRALACPSALRTQPAPSRATTGAKPKTLPYRSASSVRTTPKRVPLAFVPHVAPQDPPACCWFRVGHYRSVSYRSSWRGRRRRSRWPPRRG